MWGWNHTNIYDCFPIDVLHQDYNGVCRHLLEVLEPYLRDPGKELSDDGDQLHVDINDRLKQLKHSHEAFFPTNGLDAPKTTAEEIRGMFQFLPFAMYGIVPDHVAELFAGKLRVSCWNMQKACII